VRSPYATPQSQNQRCGAAAGAIIATLSGSDTCTALGLTVQSPSPVLALCRKLIVYGFDPAIPIHVFRGGDTLALIVRAIGEAARLEINAKGTGFIAYRAVRAAPPIAPNVPARTGYRARREAAQ
jgi:hypothetical protein